MTLQNILDMVVGGMGCLACDREKERPMVAAGCGWCADWTSAKPTLAQATSIYCAALTVK